MQRIIRSVKGDLRSASASDIFMMNYVRAINHALQYCYQTDKMRIL